MQKKENKQSFNETNNIIILVGGEKIQKCKSSYTRCDVKDVPKLS